MFLARASSLAMLNARRTSASSHDAAMPMVMGNTVAVPLRATPCSVSFHHWKAGMPSRSMAGDTSIMIFAFSSSVSRWQRSRARSSLESAGF